MLNSIRKKKKNRCGRSVYSKQHMAPQKKKKKKKKLKDQLGGLKRQSKTTPKGNGKMCKERKKLGGKKEGEEHSGNNTKEVPLTGLRPH